MRPANDERVIVEYARVHRLLEADLLSGDVEDFGEDLVGRLTTGVDLSGRWWHREWRLGNLDARRDDGHDRLISVSAQLGWYDEATTSDVPPPYDEAEHAWASERTRAREGALALFVVDLGSHIVGVTSLAGDVSMAGFCHALTDLLNQAETQQSTAERGLRSKREWLVEAISEKGTFEAWVQSVDKVVRVSARFHLPNPRSRDEIDPVVDYLNGLGAARGSVSAANPEGLDPYGHPIMVGAIAMQENDYGTITAQGLRESEEESFASREHPAQDLIPPDPEDPSLSSAGLIAKMLRALADRLERGLR